MYIIHVHSLTTKYGVAQTPITLSLISYKVHLSKYRMHTYYVQKVKATPHHSHAFCGIANNMFTPYQGSADTHIGGIQLGYHCNQSNDTIKKYKSDKIGLSMQLYQSHASLGSGNCDNQTKWDPCLFWQKIIRLVCWWKYTGMIIVSQKMHNPNFICIIPYTLKQLVICKMYYFIVHKQLILCLHEQELFHPQLKMVAASHILVNNQANIACTEIIFISQHRILKGNANGM